MTLFKVDDGMWGHPKFDDVSDAAVALWTRAGSWCCRYLTDGLVPLSRVTQLRGTEASADELVRAGLWHRVDGGFRFHDWSDIQDTKAEVETRRSKQRDEKRQQRSTKPKKKSEMSGADSVADSAEESRIGMERRSSESLSSELSDARVANDVPEPPLVETPKHSPEDFVRARRAVRMGFQARWERVQQGPWMFSSDPGVERITHWALAMPGDTQAVIAKTLDGFFADPYCVSLHFPIGMLAKNPERYFEPRPAPLSLAQASPKSTVASLRAEIGKAAAAEDYDRARMLQRQLEHAERQLPENQPKWGNHGR